MKRDDSRVRRRPRGGRPSMSKTSRALSFLLAVPLLAAGACATDGSGPGTMATAKDPATAEKVAVDRFSDQAGMLQRRSASPSLPGPNQPVSFDQAPFITQALGPQREKVRYHNFDVRPTVPAPLLVL